MRRSHQCYGHTRVYKCLRGFIYRVRTHGTTETKDQLELDQMGLLRIGDRDATAKVVIGAEVAYSCELCRG
eukprot:3113843-Prymnesium_polylepis.3